MLAESYLAEAPPTRWRHVQAVATKATRVASMLSPDDAEVLVAAAWLHDVGYAPHVVNTGLHSLDGARQLLRDGIPRRVADLVAYHSCATFEATKRGLASLLTEEFTDEKSSVTDALWYADMTTGPSGHSLSVSDRLGEVRQRYGPEHVITRFWAQAEPTLVAAVTRTEERLGTQPR
ncbi:HD domain-containing protein [Actinoplanes regularis]|uniref:HD domain-containing protein n=1 Tax=Actinoplanes regularis TaxID=52697 RepID=UPI000B77DAC0|nr:HD domain-containing protein [Actinoplanes regularis]